MSSDIETYIHLITSADSLYDVHIHVQRIQDPEVQRLFEELVLRELLNESLPVANSNLITSFVTTTRSFFV